MKLLDIISERILNQQYRFIVQLRFRNTAPKELADVVRALDGVKSALMIKSGQDNTTNLKVTILSNKTPKEAYASFKERLLKNHSQISGMDMIKGTLERL